jgi:hypothetical protein
MFSGNYIYCPSPAGRGGIGLRLRRFLKACLPVFRSSHCLEIPHKAVAHQISSIRMVADDLLLGQVRLLSCRPNDVRVPIDRAVVPSQPGIGLLKAATHRVRWDVRWLASLRRGAHGDPGGRHISSTLQTFRLSVGTDGNQVSQRIPGIILSCSGRGSGACVSILLLLGR